MRNPGGTITGATMNNFFNGQSSPTKVKRNRTMAGNGDDEYIDAEEEGQPEHRKEDDFLFGSISAA